MRWSFPPAIRGSSAKRPHRRMPCHAGGRPMVAPTKRCRYGIPLPKVCLTNGDRRDRGIAATMRLSASRRARGGGRYTSSAAGMLYRPTKYSLTNGDRRDRGIAATMRLSASRRARGGGRYTSSAAGMLYRLHYTIPPRPLQWLREFLNSFPSLWGARRVQFR